MDGPLILSPVDTGRLDRWLDMLATPGGVAAALDHALTEARPWSSPALQVCLAAAETDAAPRPWVMLLAVQVDPAAYRDEILSTGIAQGPTYAATCLQLMSISAAPYVVSIDPDVMLAWFSEAYRFDLTGTGVGDVDAPAYDGPPLLPLALGRGDRVDIAGDGRLRPAQVSEMAAALTAIDLDQLPKGDLRVVFEYLEDFVDPDYDLSPVSLQEQVRLEIEGLAEHYRLAALHGLGMSMGGPG